jgi:hypothetical protein
MASSRRARHLLTNFLRDRVAASRSDVKSRAHTPP